MYQEFSVILQKKVTRIIAGAKEKEKNQVENSLRSSIYHLKLANIY